MYLEKLSNFEGLVIQYGVNTNGPVKATGDKHIGLELQVPNAIVVQGNDMQQSPIGCV